jgi:non-specific serine/threonine protein kinase
MLKEYGFSVFGADVISALAGLDARANPARAVRLAAAANLHGRDPDPRHVAGPSLRRPWSGDLKKAEVALGPDLVRAAEEAGRRLTFEEALELAAEGEPAPAAGRLSRRELEVAILVAQGRSNKQIAGRLYLSERTIEGHVQHALNKLGFDSRSQLAAWIATHDLLPEKQLPITT